MYVCMQQCQWIDDDACSQCDINKEKKNWYFILCYMNECPSFQWRSLKIKTRYDILSIVLPKLCVKTPTPPESSPILFESTHSAWRVQVYSPDPKTSGTIYRYYRKMPTQIYLEAVVLLLLSIRCGWSSWWSGPCSFFFFFFLWRFKEINQDIRFEEMWICLPGRFCRIRTDLKRLEHVRYLENWDHRQLA